MVKHIILWQLKDELSDTEKAAVKAGIKEGLEGLVGKVPGLLEVHVNINGLPTSNADVMLDTTLENFEALKGYAVHPAHVAGADGKGRPYTPRPAGAWTTRCKPLSVSHPLDSSPDGGAFFACAVKFQKLALRESCQNRRVLTERALSSYFY